MTYEREFQQWWRGFRDQYEINSYPSYDEISEWWEQKIKQAQLQTEDSIYRTLKHKVVTLMGGIPVVHADFLEEIKTKTVYCKIHKTQFQDVITKRCPRCRTVTIVPLNELIN